MDAAVNASARRVRGKWSWILLAIFSALPIVFGSSFIWFPSQDVRDHNGTNGLFHVNRYAWGAFVIISALAMLVVAVTGFRKGERWAWNAAWYIIAFYAIVAVIEPDYFFPVIFAIIIVSTLVYSRPWFNRLPRRT
jgi:hypothetical protein